MKYEHGLAHQKNNDFVNNAMEFAKSLGISQQYCDDEKLVGSNLTVNKKKLLNFGSCSYLGLERHPNLVAGGIEAITKYGTQFSCSRSYMSIKLYKELEELLFKIFNQSLLVTPTTTLGHLATLQALMTKDDLIVLDKQAHASLQTAAQLVKSFGINVVKIPHNGTTDLEEILTKDHEQYQRIWYVLDGMYSMYGDLAPFKELNELQEKYPKLFMYVDDAHGMSWTGKNGNGYAFENVQNKDRTIFAISMNKAFSAAGGVIVFPNEEMRDIVKNTGGTYIFSGPIQPPMLGVAIESAKIHLSADIIEKQLALKTLISEVSNMLDEKNIPYIKSHSPIFYTCMGKPDSVIMLAKALIDDGFWINAAGYPATPINNGGIRFSCTLQNDKQAYETLTDALKFHFEKTQQFIKGDK